MIFHEVRINKTRPYQKIFELHEILLYTLHIDLVVFLFLASNGLLQRLYRFLQTERILVLLEQTNERGKYSHRRFLRQCSLLEFVRITYGFPLPVEAKNLV